MSKAQRNAEIALQIVESSPSVALRTRRGEKNWETLFITGNVASFGYAREDFLNGKLSWMDVVHPDDLAVLCEKMEGYADEGIDKYTVYYRVVTKGGNSVWVAESATITRGEAGEVLYADCVVSDQTLMMESREKIGDHLKQQRVLNEILQTLHTGDLDEALQIILEQTGRYLGISRVLLLEDDDRHETCQVVYEWYNTGVPPAQKQGNFTLNYKKDIPEVAKGLDKAGMMVINSGSLPKKSARTLKEHGVKATAAYAVYLGEVRYGFICFDECAQERQWPEDTLVFLRNISRLVSTALMHKGNEESIQRMAFQDQLTGLVNRYRFDFFIERAIEAAAKAKEYGYVMFLDMDDFKVINEGYGHHYGDALLITVAEYLMDAFGECSRIFRFGGDEFALLVEHQSAAGVQEMVDRLLARARHPWLVRDREFYCTISIGVVRFPDGNMSAGDVTKCADIAMYQAKNQGKNSFAMYSSEMNQKSLHRAETEHCMREAIDNGFMGFMVYYQPIVDVAGGVTGAEALVRWVDEKGNLVLPGEFVPLAEYLGLIVPLGEFVLRNAAAECQRINQTLPDFTMNVNVSVRQFQQKDFLHSVEKILKETKVKPGNLVLEVTEGMMVQDMEHMQRIAEQLRKMGMAIAMDDFGTGYSSLNNMRQLPLDIIKIDRSFIKDVTRDAYAKSFIHMITDLAHSMGRSVCVEGVETAAQQRYCAECGVDYIQGFYFYRPMPLEDMRKVLPTLGA